MGLGTGARVVASKIFATNQIVNWKLSKHILASWSTFPLPSASGFEHRSTPSCSLWCKPWETISHEKAFFFWIFLPTIMIELQEVANTLTLWIAHVTGPMRHLSVVDLPHLQQCHQVSFLSQQTATFTYFLRSDDIVSCISSSFFPFFSDYIPWNKATEEENNISSHC